MVNFLCASLSSPMLSSYCLPPLLHFSSLFEGLDVELVVPSIDIIVGLVWSLKILSLKLEEVVQQKGGGKFQGKWFDWKGFGHLVVTSVVLVLNEIFIKHSW